MDGNYVLNIGMWSGIFAVPNELVDKELRMAGCAQLKVMLYLLRHSGESVTAQTLAMQAGVSEGDARDAAAYWMGRGLVREQSGQLVPAASEKMPAEHSGPAPSETLRSALAETAAVSPAAANTEQAEMPLTASAANSGKADEPSHKTSDDTSDEPSEEPQEKKPRRREKMRYSYEEAAEMITEDPDLGQMLRVLEGMLSKQLNHTEIAVFVTMVRWYGLPSSCVAMLVEYCRSIGHSTLAYIEQTGIGWSQEEIFTVEQADAKIRRLRVRRAAWTKVRELLDIPERKPSENEQSLSEAWVSEWGMPDELIRLAYDRCVDKKGKLSFSYMNGILRRWKESGLMTADAVLTDESAGKREGQQARSGERYAPTYDISEIEQQLDQEWLDDTDDAI